MRYMAPPTEKQLDFIHSIEDLTGVEFTGKTKADASAYIDANIDEFRKQEKLEGILEGLLHEDAGDRPE